jgi:hypothetical protein
MSQKIDNPALKKYFWDHTENASDAFKLKRLVEYASFPDLIKIPFDFVKMNIDTLEPSALRTSETRKEFMSRVKGVAHQCGSWDDAVYKITGVE